MNPHGADTEGANTDSAQIEGDASAPRPVGQEPGGREQPGPRVLIVDDDEAFRTAMRQMLEESGIEIIGEVAWGEMGSVMATAVHPDVVLMDYRMAGGDGIQATRSIKAALPTTQVLMLSAYDDAQLRYEAEKAGVYAYIPKGSPPREVRQRILEAWEQRQRLSGRSQPSAR